MNEIALSDDLTTITTEIKSYQSIGGQAIFEIGRRLKHVKEHDLAHGQYIEWLNSINMNRRQASRFIKVVTEFPNGTTSSHLGMNVLYEIATMPEEEREKPHELSNGEIKKPEDMTVRELREVKRQLKRTQEELEDRNLEVQRLQERPEKVKTVEKRVEVKPADYDSLKDQVKDVSHIKMRNDFLQKQLDQANKDVDYYKNELNKAEQNIKRETKFDEDKLQQRQLERKKRQAELNSYEIASKIKELVSSVWLDDTDINQLNDLGDQAKNNLIRNLDQLQKFIDKARKALQGRTFIEGEIINEN